MLERKTTGLQISGTNTRLEQTLSQLHIPASSGSNPACQDCGETLEEGDRVTLYLYQPTTGQAYQVGQCRCSTHNNDLTDLLTLGINELIVDGRVGQCRDQSTQQTWPVLIAPSIRLISGRDTNTGRLVKTQQDEDPTKQLTVEVKQSTESTHQHSGNSSDDDTPNRQETALARWDQPATTAEGK